VISAVIPAYNAARWLPAALASVRAQTPAPDEIIVVDNNSSDESAAIAAALGAIVLHEPLPGAAAARNRGIEAARSEWIALLDADDYWLPGKLARQRSLVEQFPDVRLVTANYFFDRDGTLSGPAFQQVGEAYLRLSKRPLTDDAARVTVDHLSEQLAAGNPWLGLNSSAVFFRKEDALAAGGFDITFPRLEDMEFFARLLRRVDSVAFIETPLAATAGTAKTALTTALRWPNVTSGCGRK
jgi:glycosyltransferase involved in cell wall biosynthesis